jgi:hypothetical protein
MNRVLRGDHCQCSGPPYRGCGQHFNSVRAFDKHRTGEWTNRRCLTVDEMGAKGMALSSTGFWVSNPSPQGRFEAALRGGGQDTDSTRTRMHSSGDLMRAAA